METLENFLFFSLFYHNDSGLIGPKEARAWVIWDFSLETLECFLFCFCPSRNVGRRRRSEHGIDQGKKIFGKLKFWLFIDRYRIVRLFVKGTIVDILLAHNQHGSTMRHIYIHHIGHLIQFIKPSATYMYVSHTKIKSNRHTWGALHQWHPFFINWSIIVTTGHTCCVSSY